MNKESLSMIKYISFLVMSAFVIPAAYGKPSKAKCPELTNADFAILVKHNKIDKEGVVYLLNGDSKEILQKKDLEIKPDGLFARQNGNKIECFYSTNKGYVGIRQK